MATVVLHYNLKSEIQMNRAQHYSLLRAMEIDKKNLLKYQEIYNYAYILSDGIFMLRQAQQPISLGP